MTTQASNSRWTRHAGNVLTLLRVLLVPVFVWGVGSATALHGWIAAVAFVAAAASDVYDGRLARRFGQASDAGRFLDHFADIAFLLCGYGAFVARGEAPWWVPAAIALAFGTYVVDSWLRSQPAQPSLIGSRLGHWGGVANYFLLGVLTFNAAAEIRLLPAAWVAALLVLVPVYSAAAVAARLMSARTAGR